MSKELAVVALGVWVIIVPNLGVPSSWKMILFLLTGLGLVGLGLLLRAEALTRGNKRGTNHSFVENLPAGKAGSATDVLETISENARKERITSLN